MGKSSGGGRATTKFGAVPAPSNTPSGKQKSEEDRLRLAPAVENDDNEDTASAAVPVMNLGKQKSEADRLSLAPAVANDNEDTQGELPLANANNEPILDDVLPHKNRHDGKDDNERAEDDGRIEDEDAAHNIDGGGRGGEEAAEPVHDIEQPANNAQEDAATLILEGVLAPSLSPGTGGDDILVVEGKLRPTKEEEEEVARRQSCYLIGVIVCILSVVALVLILTFTLREQERVIIVRDTSDAANNAPSLAPTALERNFELEQQVIQMLQPWLDEEELQRDASSPEAKALQWLVYDDAYLSLETRLKEIEAEDLLQRHSLVAFYYSTGGDQTWFRQSNFLSNQHECDWTEEQEIDLPESQIINDSVISVGFLSRRQGVLCESNDTHHVTDIVLQANRLSSSLPTWLGHLGSLEVISFPLNELTGSLPMKWDSLVKIWQFDLGGNSISGTLSPQLLSHWTNVTVFNLAVNNIGGTIPSSMCDLSHLQDLWLYENVLTGPIPSELGQLTALTLLSLENNNLSGGVPSHFVNIANLQALQLSDNALTGPIPSELGQLTTLTSLHIATNTLSGTIPSQLGRITNLRALVLFNTGLTGTIPSELGQLTAMADLILYANLFNGPIPTELGRMTNLQDLWLSKNRLTGKIPAELGQLTAMTFLYLYTNLLSGSLPSELGRLTSLQDLRLFDNALTGPIPSELGQLTAMRKFILHANLFSSSIPSQFASMTNLLDMVLYENALTGPIPSEFGYLTSMTDLIIHANLFSGPIPSEFGRLTTLQGLWLSKNALTGTIPSEFGQLTAMTRLDLYTNLLGGRLPSELGRMISLRNLRLYENALTGSIPSELGQLTAMTNLELDSNTLSGSLPSEFASMRNLTALWLYENALTGPIPTHSLGKLSSLSALALHGNNDLIGNLDEPFCSPLWPVAWQFLSSDCGNQTEAIPVVCSCCTHCF